MHDEIPTTWTRTRRRLDADRADLHPFLSAVAWGSSIGIGTAAAWLALEGTRPGLMWPVAVSALAFSLAYPFLLYAHWSGAFYEREREEPVTTEAAPALVRPFIASQNAPATIQVGTWRLTRDNWDALFAVARANGGRLTRDAVQRSRALPRNFYYNWSATLGELVRLGLVDETGRVTAQGWNFYRRDISPSPNNDESPVRGTGTHARRTHDAHGVDLTPVGEAD